CKQDVVHEEGHGPTVFDGQKGFGVVFGGNDVHAQVLFFIGGGSPTNITGAGRRNHDFAFQIFQGIDIGRFFGHESGGGNKRGGGKCHLHLALDRVGR